MSARQDGGPAFPLAVTVDAVSEQHIHLGMTLRDYFAASVINGIGNWTPFVRGRESDHEARARYAYETADAMLAARAKGGQS